MSALDRRLPSRYLITGLVGVGLFALAYIVLVASAPAIAIGIALFVALVIVASVAFWVYMERLLGRWSA